MVATTMGVSRKDTRRARCGIRVAAASLLIAALPIGPPALANEGANWTATTFVATTSPASIGTVTWELKADTSEDAPLLLGLGVSRGHRSIIEVLPVDDTAGAAAHFDGADWSVWIDITDSTMTAFGAFSGAELSPSEAMSVVIFVPGGEIVSARTEATTLSGSPTINRSAGGGARAVTPDRGLAVTALGASVSLEGRTSHSVPSPIVGSAVTSCESCAGGSERPDGTATEWTGRRELTTHITNGMPWFAGTAGSWSWWWDGLRGEALTGDAIAAYAPVGESIASLYW